MTPLYLFFASIYIFRFIFFSIGNLKRDYIHRINRIYSFENSPFVSIIVPARNEEENIQRCVESIFSSESNGIEFELIVIDDRSTDNTFTILTELQKRFPQLRIVKIESDSEKMGIKGKPGALHKGILESNGDIILMTDADCTVHSLWLQTMVASFQESDSIGLVASFTLINEQNFFHKLQAIEWIQAHTLARGGVNMNSPIGCFGNNLAIRKKAYFALGGYEKIPFSVTEDLALLQAMSASEFSIRYICDEHATVVTEPTTTLKEFIYQHHRWAVGGLSLKWKAALLIMYSLSMWIAVLLATWNFDFIWMGSLIGIKFLTDFLLVNVSFHRLNSRHNTWFIYGEVFMILVEIFLPFTMLKKTVEWKGQIFK
jgi:1,2-diacylglycerol 3-beta-glucosyltransferase